MTPEKQRIAIAKVCWWAKSDCLTDLNSCHEMEKVLTYEQNEQFVFWLNHLHPYADIHRAEKKRDLRMDVFDLVHATAAQRAEAFLRTLGLWEEEK